MIHCFTLEIKHKNKQMKGLSYFCRFFTGSGYYPARVNGLRCFVHYTLHNKVGRA